MQQGLRSRHIRREQDGAKSVIGRLHIIRHVDLPDDEIDHWAARQLASIIALLALCFLPRFLFSHPPKPDEEEDGSGAVDAAAQRSRRSPTDVTRATDPAGGGAGGGASAALWASPRKHPTRAAHRLAAGTARGRVRA